MRKLVVLLTALAVMTSLLAGLTHDPVSAGSVPVTAPVSAEYLAAQAGNVLPAVAERPLGFVPSPVDLSHLTSFQPTGQDALGVPAQYDLRTPGRLSPVRNQGTCGCCWAFAAYGSLESVALPVEQWDFSEQNLKNLSGFDYGACGAGNATMAVAYMARWAGPVREADDPYNAGISASPAGLTVPRYLSAALAIPDRKNALDYPLDYGLDNAALKSAVQQWGAVQTSMYWTDGSYNEGPHSYYYNGSGTSNHDVAIVGWNDSYSRLNFKTAPAGDGAFIIRNSWGTGWGDAGYFYVSYYDSVIGRNNWVFVLGTGAPVDTHNYGYDDLGWVGSLGFASPTAWGANVFTLNAGSGSEVIDRVGFYTTDSGTSYTLRIYGTVSGADFSNKLTEESGAFDEAGYHTVSLASPVTVAHGQKIAVAVGMTTSGWACPLAYEYAQGGYSSAAVAAPGQSYRSSNGTSWSDLTSLNTTANLCIRAFTHDAVPSVPSAPVLSSPADGCIAGSLTPTLAWRAAVGATSYTVQVNGDIAFFGAPQFTQSGVTGTSIVVTTSLPPGTDLYWRVNATNAVGTSYWSSTWRFTTPAALEIPAVPILLSPPSGQVTSSLAPTLTWAASARAAFYTVELSRFDYFPDPLVWRSQSTTETTVTTPTLAPSTLYFWHVRATNAAGSITSVQHNFTTPAAVTPLAPVLSSPADGTTLGSLSPTLTWAAAAGAASYTVQASLSNTFGTTILSQTTLATSLTMPALAAATRHYWRVNATNAAGTSPWSSIWSFTTPPVYTLTLDTIGSGSVVKSPNQSSYVSGTVVTLTATPLAGSSFTGWSGDLTGTTNPATVTMNTNKAITATFTADAYTLTVTPPVNGTVTKSPDQATYSYGTVVTLTATPAYGYGFAVWTGNLSGSTNPASITMMGNRTVTATFTAIPTYTLSTTASPSQGGTIGKSPNQSSYLAGTVVTLTAAPLAGYAFTSWSGSLSGTTNPATVTMTSNKTVTATFTALPTYTLSTTVSPTLGGTIGKSPNQSSYLASTVVTLTATPLAGYTFTSWSGDLTGSTNPATITMTANKTVAATFTAVPTYMLTPSAGTWGTITPSTPQTVPQGGSRTFTITPSTGYHVQDVLVDGVSTGAVTTYTFTNVQASHTIHATFTINMYTLTVTPPVNGTVKKNPDQATYAYNASVTLTATPAAGYTFTGWSGDLTGSTNPATITMTANKAVAATFLALGPGSVYVVATLDGAPWSGEVRFSLTDGVSVITGSAVPFYMEEVNPGSFTIDATGGPAGKVLRWYAPNKTQHVTSGLGTTFTLEYWSEATVPGDLAITKPLPGEVTGSSVDVEGLAYGCPPGGSPLTVTARILPSGDPVTIINNMHIDPTAETWSGSLTAAALGLTTPSDVEIVARLTGFPSGTETRIIIHWSPASARMLALRPGWNLVGVSSPLPLVAVPGFIQCFGYRNGWSVLGTGEVLQPGLGYWLQVADAVDVVLPGLETSGPVSVTYDVGWQLLGNPYSVPVPVTSITHWNLVTTCFLYGPAWGSVDVVTGNLDPGRGYWINLTAAATLTLTRP